MKGSLHCAMKGGNSAGHFCQNKLPKTKLQKGVVQEDEIAEEVCWASGGQV